MSTVPFQSTRHGLLELDFRQIGGRTVLTRDHQKAPLMVVRPFTLPCGTLMVFVVNPTGGTLGGDTAEIRVSVGPGARALVLTQSAARLQPSPTGAEAVQRLHFTVAAGGRLEYYPERTLPYAGSRFAQTLRAELEPGAEFGLCETLATGRVLKGERLAFSRYRSRVEVRVDGRLAYLDRLELQPDIQPLTAPGLLGGHDYSAAGVWVGGGRVEAFPSAPGLLATGRNAAGAVWLRATASRGPELDAALSQAREALRGRLFGAAPLQVRR